MLHIKLYYILNYITIKLYLTYTHPTLRIFHKCTQYIYDNNISYIYK